MRITGGKARGIPLRVPKGDTVRPATDSLRQAVFSSLGGRVAGVQFLDLFAGSGAYGLEAISRGAAGGVFVEHNARAAACLRGNLTAVCKSLGRDENGLRILQLGALSLPPAAAGAPDLVFIDPPYDQIDTVVVPLFARLATLLEGRPEVLVMIEVPGEREITVPGWTCVHRLGKHSRQPNAVFFQR
jgi:16S rRNA (guanine966-N2)-methyltransferase